ncbi:MAG: hypothetical protein F4Z08_10055 [Chloroflexi bacterium]|nr:hypothetical protein [Chloroflexota bacterium]
MAEMNDPVERLAAVLADYREGELPRPNAEHIERWVGQFDSTARDAILHELSHVFGQTYLSRATVADFLASLAKSNKVAGPDPEDFWRGANFLNIQERGQSQKELLDLFSGVLKAQYGFGIEECGSAGGTFVYLDDGVFTGNRLLSDLELWDPSRKHRGTRIHVIAAAIHRGAVHYVQSRLSDYSFRWSRVLQLENRKSEKNISDVLWPAAIPDDELVREYCEMLGGEGYPPTLRRPGKSGSEFFSSEPGRQALEEQFLKAGCKIRALNPNLNNYQRPLGNMVLRGLGFGTLVVTYRNCPNNAPLALWAGDPWYPLLPRKTNWQ